MTLRDLLRHQWRRQVRSPTWGRSLIGGLLLVLAAAYFGLLFVSLGWFYPDVVAEVAPQQDPLRLLNEYLLYAALGLIIGRFFLQRSAGSDVQAYLPLPIREGRLARILQVLSALSLFNLLPLLTLAAFWGSTVWPAVSVVGAVCWGGGVFLLLAATQFLNSLLRALWNRNAGLVLGAAGLLTAFVAVGNRLDVGLVRAASTWLFGGLAAGRVGPLLVLIGVAGGTAVAAHRGLRTRLYDVLGDGAAGARGSGTRSALLGRRWSQRPVVSLVLLDARLILRNKRSRQLVGVGLPVLALITYVFFSGDLDSFEAILFTFILSGILAMPYSRFSYAWHGHHFDALLMRFPPRRLVRAQYATFAGLCVIAVAGAAPLLAVLRPELLGPLGVFLLYHLGVSAPIQLGLGTWAREAIELGQTTMFNYQGTSTVDFLAILLIMAIPLGLVIGVGEPITTIAIAGVGAVGVVSVPLWTRGLGRLLRGQRHAMASGFRGE